MYVKGSSDVYIFQVWLRKFLKVVEEHDANAIEVSPGGTSRYIKFARYKLGDRFEIENKIGIFHLCGDFWPHLLYTVPKRPYRCVVILDGNKKGLVPEIIMRHNQSGGITPSFKFADSIADVARTMRSNNGHPIYCLEKESIEGYLGSIPAGYDKKLNGPRLAEQLGELPEEIFELFRIIIEEMA